MLLSLEGTEPNPLGSTSTIPVPMMTSTESLRASGLERNIAIWYLLKHNWRQLTSLIPGLVLLFALGNLHVSWTIWQMLLYVFDNEAAELVETSVLICWFVGVVGGAIFGAFLNSSWSKILIYYSTAMALIPVSTTFVFHNTSSYNLLLIGRTLAGFLYGVSLVTLVLHIADNSSQFMRRHFMWSISAINLLPTVLVAQFISTVTQFDISASIGVIMFALAIITLFFMPCTYESIVFLLANGTDLRALEIMLKLRNESRHFIRRDFNEFKMMLVEDYSDDGNIFANGNSRPLVLVLLLRLLNVLLTSSCVYWIFLTNFWFDYCYWTRPISLAELIVEVARKAYENETNFNETLTNATTEMSLEDNSTSFINSISLINGTDSNSPLNSIPLLGNLGSFFDPTTLFSSMSSFNLTDEEFGISTTVMPMNRSALSFNQPFDDMENITKIMPIASSLVDHSFVHTAYSYRLSALPIAKYLFIVYIVKIVVGIPFMCLAEKFQVYRNRLVFKVTLYIAVVNLIFFMATIVCYRIDDSLIFTFYIAKLLTVVYGLYLVIAFPIDTIGYCELAESFSLTKRYGCIALIVICEHLFQALAILLIMNALFPFYFHAVQSLMICCICYMLLRRMPNECLNSTLRSARDKHFMKMATANN